MSYMIEMLALITIIFAFDLVAMRFGVDSRERYLKNERGVREDAGAGGT
jgi:hypothetical protein